MKRILHGQKLILIAFTVLLLQLIFSTGNNIPVVSGDQASDCLTFSCFSPDVLLRQNGTPHSCRGAGAPSCSDSAGGWSCDACPAAPPVIPPPPGCESLGCEGGEVVLLHYGTPHSCRNASSDSCYGQAPEWTCTGVCPAAAPPPADPPPAAPPPAAPPPADPPPAAPPPADPPVPPCAKWQNDDPNSGICEMVATSLFQGKAGKSGDISTDPSEFIVRILTIILSFAGGIALILIISAGYKIITSKGKPEGIQQGRDQLISAIVGLVFIIFSFVIFQLVVTDLLKIPGITK